MAEHRLMTEEEKIEICLRAIELKKQGKLEESMELRKTVPLQPYLAMIIKKNWGAENLIKTGWNLLEAEAEFGSDWLTK